MPLPVFLHVVSFIYVASVSPQLEGASRQGSGVLFFLYLLALHCGVVFCFPTPHPENRLLKAGMSVGG